MTKRAKKESNFCESLLNIFGENSPEAVAANVISENGIAESMDSERWSLWLRLMYAIRDGVEARAKTRFSVADYLNATLAECDDWPKLAASIPGRERDSFWGEIAAYAELWYARKHPDETPAEPGGKSDYNVIVFFKDLTDPVVASLSVPDELLDGKLDKELKRRLAEAVADKMNVPVADATWCGFSNLSGADLERAGLRGKLDPTRVRVYVDQGETIIPHKYFTQSILVSKCVATRIREYTTGVARQPQGVPISFVARFPNRNEMELRCHATETGLSALDAFLFKPDGTILAGPVTSETLERTWTIPAGDDTYEVAVSVTNH